MRILFISLYSFFFFVSVNSVVFAQSSDVDCGLSNLYINQKTGDFYKYITILDAQISKTNSADLKFKRLLVRHFYIAHLLFYDNGSDQIELHLDLMEKEIEELEALPKYTPAIAGIKAAYYSYTALENPSTAVFYLPKSFSLAKDAVETYAQNPYCWAEYGNLEYGYSVFLGGDFSKAITYFNTAVLLFEKSGTALKCNWYYINTLLFLAKSYEDNKQFAEANKVYNKILALRPDYTAINRWKHKL